MMCETWILVQVPKQKNAGMPEMWGITQRHK